MRPGKTSITGHTFCPSGKVDSDDFSHKKWALTWVNVHFWTHFLSYKPKNKVFHKANKKAGQNFYRSDLLKLLVAGTGFEPMTFGL